MASTALLAFCLVPAVAASPTPSSALQYSALQSVGLVDGAWIGRLSYNALVVYDDEIAASYYGSGSLHVTAAGGGVEGVFVFQQATIVTPPESPSALAIADVTGTIGGGPSAMELVYEEIDVTSTSSGVTAELTFTAAELGNPTITVVATSGSCGSVSGFWNSEFAQGLGNQGEFIAGREGTWVAHRTSGEGPPGIEYEATLSEVEADAAVLIEQLRDGGPWSADIVGDVLSRAEQLAVNGLRRSNCDSNLDDTAFRNRAFATVAQLLEEAALSEGVFADAILELMIAGYRSGVFAVDTELRDFYQATFEELVTQTISEGSEQELVTLYAAATQLGEEDLAAQIAELLGLVEG